MHRVLQGNVAQWLEPLPFKQHYVGSNPTILKKKITGCTQSIQVFFKSLKEVYIYI